MSRLRSNTSLDKTERDELTKLIKDAINVMGKAALNYHGFEFVEAVQADQNNLTMRVRKQKPHDGIVFHVQLKLTQPYT
jgi:hypothetical protein